MPEPLVFTEAREQVSDHRGEGTPSQARVSSTGGCSGFPVRRHFDEATNEDDTTLQKSRGDAPHDPRACITHRREIDYQEPRRRAVRDHNQRDLDAVRVVFSAVNRQRSVKVSQTNGASLRFLCTRESIVEAGEVRRGRGRARCQRTGDQIEFAAGRM